MTKEFRHACCWLGLCSMLLAGWGFERPGFGHSRDATEKLIAELTNANGVPGFKSTHIVQPEERSRMVPLQDMFLDIGATSREQAMEQFGVRPGLPVTYGSQFEVLNGTNRYLARGIDDRALLAIATLLCS